MLDSHTIRTSSSKHFNNKKLVEKLVVLGAHYFGKLNVRRAFSVDKIITQILTVAIKTGISSKEQRLDDFPFGSCTTRYGKQQYVTTGILTIFGWKRKNASQNTCSN